MGTETTQGATTETQAAAATGDESIDAIVAAELESAAAAGTDVVPPVEKDGDEPAAPVVAANPAEPKPAADADKETTAADARKLVAQAERLKAQAAADFDKFKTDFYADLTKNPKAALAKLGAKTIDDLIDASIAEGEVKTPTESDKLSAIDKRLADIEAREQQIKVDTLVRGIHGALTPEKFPTIAAKKSQGLVTDFMQEYFQKHGKPIHWEKAAKIVEADLREFAGTPAKSAAPAAKPAAAAPVRDVHGTLENSEQRTTVQTEDDKLQGMSPDKLLEHLVTKYASEL